MRRKKNRKVGEYVSTRNKVREYGTVGSVEKCFGRKV